MSQFAMDKVLHLPEGRAIHLYFNSVNAKWFARSLVLFFLYGGLRFGQTTAEQDGGIFLLGGSVVIAALCFLLWLVRKRLASQEGFYGLLLTYLFIMMALLNLVREDFDDASFWCYLFSYILLVFRLRASGYLLMFGVNQALLLVGGYYFEGSVITISSILGTFNNIVCLIVAIMITVLYRRRFLAVWRIERNNRDRLRMKQELDHARHIQLSMLPPGLPEASHLEIACSSTPATEVGGDYYDYFELSPNKLALFIGDVSGHGVASGLVLSGVRSCLYMLRDDLPQPAELLGKLNRTLKQTTERKTFMTFQTVTFDSTAKQMVYASAGHPAILHYRAQDQTVREILQKALPLGGLLNTQYREESITFATGDVFLFYTDGLFEEENNNRDPFGMKRVTRRFKSLAFKGASAERIREVLLNDVQLHIGETEQEDDITLVVVRVK